MRKIIAFQALFFLLLVSNTGCKNYSISINENEVYTPPKIFTQFRLQDAALQHCVDQIIAEERLTKAEQVKRILCPPADIKSLEGIEIFSLLEQLGLQQNSIASIAPLAKLEKLEQINLGQNPVKDLTPLYGLRQLVFLNVEGAADLSCDHVSLLQSKHPTLKIIAPTHCKGAQI